MVRVAVCAGLLVLAGCRLMGTESHLGISEHDMNFGEVGFVLEERDGSRLQSVPFVLAGAGRLPDEYGPNNDSFQRLSLGNKARVPFPVGKKFVVYLEGGAMVSYYEADAIGTPFELEVVAGIGTAVDLGNGWSLDFAVRARHPTGNGNDHDTPEHAPDGTQGEVVFGLKKDF